MLLTTQVGFNQKEICMKLGTKAQYGTRAMLDLAVHYGEGPLVIGDVAHRQEVSEKYLENLMAQLRAGGLVRTARGSRGGYALSRSPSQITLGEVVRILDGSLALVPCLDDPELCHRVGRCVTRRIWSKLYERIADVLDNITLADMVQMHNEPVPRSKEDVGGQE